MGQRANAKKCIRIERSKQKNDTGTKAHPYSSNSVRNNWDSNVTVRAWNEAISRDLGDIHSRAGRDVMEHIQAVRSEKFRYPGLHIPASKKERYRSGFTGGTNY